MLTSSEIRKILFTAATGIVLFSLRLDAITPDEITREEQLLQRTADDRREKAVLRFRELALAEAEASKTKPLQERLIDKFDIALSYLESLDRNANYDSAHKRDWTQQMIFQTLFKDI